MLMSKAVRGSGMAERNSTTETYPRRPISPELWIPYVLIGVSCVTFLAVHFWCYHKRNRERYLRKRDEKRVKSGLLERRRITTLMLARYQSDLGISQSETEVDLAHDVLFYDNSAEVFLDDNDSHINNGTKKSHTFQNSADVAAAASLGPEKTVPGNSTGSSDNANFGAASKALPNSQTWPRVSERKSASYNAHVGCIHNGEAAAAAAGGGQKTVVLMDYDDGNDSTKDLRRPSEPPDYQTAMVHCMPRGASNAEPLTTIKPLREAGSEISQASAACVLKSALPPTTYPNVFYTNLNTPYDTNTTLFKPFKSNQKKRRHDGVPVEDTENIHRGHNGMPNSNIHEQEETCRPQNNSEKGRTHPYTISGAERHRMNYIYGSNDNHFCPIRTAEASGFGISKDEAFPFAEAGHAYGSIKHDSAGTSAQMIPLHEIRRNLPSQMHDLRLTQPRDISRHGHDGQPYILFGQDSVGAESSTDIDVEIMESNIQPHSRIHKPQNIVIPMPDRSVLNMISKTPGKIRAGCSNEDDSYRSWASRSRPGPLARMDTFDNFGSDPELQSIHGDHEQDDQDDAQNKVPPALTSEQIHTQTVSPGVSVVKDIPANSDANIDNAHDVRGSLSNNNTQPRLTQDGVIHTHPHPPLQTPSLRGLDPKLVFHHTKRKLGTKPDQSKHF